jgi:transposase InsO family protein
MASSAVDGARQRRRRNVLRHLKKELVHRRSWPTRLELQSAVFEYIEAFYNRQRRHSTLDMRSPIAYEQLRLSPLHG